MKTKTIYAIICLFALGSLVFGIKSISAMSESSYEIERISPIGDFKTGQVCTTTGAKQCRDNDATYQERTCESYGAWSAWTDCCTNCNCGAGASYGCQLD